MSPEKNQEKSCASSRNSRFPIQEQGGGRLAVSRCYAWEVRNMWQVWKWPWQRWALVLCLGGAFGTGAYVGVKWCVEPNPPDTIEQSIRKFEDAADHHKKRLDDLEQFVRKKKAP